MELFKSWKCKYQQKRKFHWKIEQVEALIEKISIIKDKDADGFVSIKSCLRQNLSIFKLSNEQIDIFIEFVLQKDENGEIILQGDKTETLFLAFELKISIRAVKILFFNQDMGNDAILYAIKGISPKKKFENSFNDREIKKT